MKRYNTGYYIKEGATGIFSHGFMSFASVCIIVACLIIMGSFSLLAVNVNSIIDEFKKQNQLLAYVNDTLTVDEAIALESRIEALPNVDHATFITNKEAMDIFTSKYQDQSVFESMEEDVLRHRYEVYMRDISLTEQTQNDLKAINGIAKVGANLEISKGLMTVSKIVSGVSFIIVAILLFISLFIMSNTIKLATFDRRDEIAIMKMVGATNKFIRWPFIFQGFILGIVGSLTAFIAQWVIYTLVSNMIVKANTLSFISPIPFAAVALPMFLVFLAVGFGVGVVGSLIAIKNYLRV
ncbi:MAG: ABC transporter permease [Clostridiales bacterium]|nr:ABC transporter permease [Clostridiales bacterium]